MEHAKFIGRLTPAVSPEDRINGEGFDGRELANIFVSPTWPCSIFVEHGSNKQRVGKLLRAEKRPDEEWCEVEASFFCNSPDSVKAYRLARAGKAYLSPAFQHPRLGTVTDPSQYYNCLTEVSLTEDPYREGARILSTSEITAHSSRGRVTVSHGGCWKVVPIKCGNSRQTPVTISKHSSAPTMSDPAKPAEQAAAPAAAPAKTPTIGAIKKAIIGKDGAVSNESLRAGVTKFGMNNAPTINELIKEVADLDDPELPAKLADKEWRLHTAATQIASQLAARNGEEPEDAAAAAAVKKDDSMPVDQEPSSMDMDVNEVLANLYKERQADSLEKFNTVAVNFVKKNHVHATGQEAEAVFSTPQFSHLSDAVAAMSVELIKYMDAEKKKKGVEPEADSCGAEVGKADPMANHSTPAVTAHSRKHAPVKKAVADALSLVERLRKNADERNTEIIGAGAPKKRVSGAPEVPAKRSRFVPSLGEDDDD